MIPSVILRGSVLWIPPSILKEARDLISSSDKLAVDVTIRAIPRYRPISALLNQFCSWLSTSTSMSLRLNSSDLLLPLETFNKEDVFIKFPVPARSCLHFAQNYPSSVSKTLQSWCRALRAFYQTSLLPLCNVFCHVYEKSLK